MTISIDKIELSPVRYKIKADIKVELVIGELGPLGDVSLGKIESKKPLTLEEAKRQLQKLISPEEAETLAAQLAEAEEVVRSAVPTSVFVHPANG